MSQTHLNSYLVAKTPVEVCYEIKKSRFIARLFRAQSREEALSHLATAKDDYPDARHHCWAYQLGSPAQPSSAAMSDDGEPSGTAGKPMLNVIQHKDLGDVMVIIIRYFGGIKLGAGGLVRAYSQATQMAFDAVETELKVAKVTAQVNCAFADEQNIRHWLTAHAAEIGHADYSDKVHLPILIEPHHLADLNSYLAAFTHASLETES